MRYTLLFILMLVTLFTKAQRHNIQYDNYTESKSDTLTSDQVRVLSQILDNMVFVDGGTYRMGEGEDEMGVSFNDNAKQGKIGIFALILSISCFCVLVVSLFLITSPLLLP